MEKRRVKYRKIESGQMTDYIYDGTFLTWGVQSIEGRENFGNDTIAIIELANGEITAVYPFDIKFVYPTEILDAL